MGYFKNRKEKRHAEILRVRPYARVQVDVKYDFRDYYMPEIYYYKTLDEYNANKEKLKSHYVTLAEINCIEDVIWHTDFAYYD